MSEHITPTPDAGGVDQVLDRIRMPALLAGMGGTLLLIIGRFVNETQFYQSYLFAYLFWIGLALGCCGLLMLVHLAGGGWGVMIRRILESGTRMLPVMALLFIPLLFGIGDLYPWAKEGFHARGFKHTWLQKDFFVIRTGVYFAVWIGFAFVLNKWSKDQDGNDDPRIARRMQLLSGPGLAFYVIMMTLAAIDWVMSLDPEWYSTMYGLLFVIGQALSCIALTIIVLTLLRDRSPWAGLVQPAHFHDLGNLLLAFTMLWAYLSFSQYLIIWSANLAEEAPYYIYRTGRGWKFVALSLVILHFFIPFILLLTRRTKRAAESLAKVAVLILIMRFVDLKWILGPSFLKPMTHGNVTLPGPAFSISWMDFVAPVAIGGIWIFVFIWQLKSRPLLPLNDPKMEDVMRKVKEAAHHG